MALRTLSRMIAAPSKTSLLGFADGLSGQGYPMTLVRRKASNPIARRLAISAAAGDNNDETSGTNLARKPSNSPASRRPSGLSRGAKPADLFLG